MKKWTTGAATRCSAGTSIGAMVKTKSGSVSAAAKRASLRVPAISRRSAASGSAVGVAEGGSPGS